ncbi:MAG TPA: hypothetical protein VI643_03735 [Planctomycetota bacterium]|nr:hypothetical protein [Planctomycetota bacterium]
MAALLLLLLQDAEWLKTPEDGAKEAARTGRPILLVTLCAPGG